MVACNLEAAELTAQCANRRAEAAETRSNGVQRIGDLLPDVLARYLPKEDIWQERSRAALATVSKAAG